MHTLPLTGKWQFRRLGDKEWLPASVPGGVHTDLLAIGRIPDPFVGDNEKAVQWVAETDWEFRRTFTPPADLLAKQRLRLVCDGLDTLAEVSLNGKQLGRADNAFRRWTFDLGGRLRKGENELLIEVTNSMANRYEPGARRRSGLMGAVHLTAGPADTRE